MRKAHWQALAWTCQYLAEQLNSCNLTRCEVCHCWSLDDFGFFRVYGMSRCCENEIIPSRESRPRISKLEVGYPWCGFSRSKGKFRSVGDAVSVVAFRKLLLPRTASPSVVEKDSDLVFATQFLLKKLRASGHPMERVVNECQFFLRAGLHRSA